MENITGKKIGYARVSSIGQTLESQVEKLQQEGCARIFQEKISGAREDRKELQRLLKMIEPGDILVVTRIDRLARSTFQLFEIIKKVTDTGAVFKSISEPWADTSTSTGRLMIAVLGGIADLERDLIRTRTAEGRARAKAKGLSIGRRRKLSREQYREARERLASGESYADVARSFNVSHTTIMRMERIWSNST